MRVIAIKPELFEQFSKKHPQASFYQTTEYGNLMSKLDYYVQYLGIIDDKKQLIGATLLLYQTVFMNYKIAYAPRGILFNYEKTDLVQEMIQVLKKALKKQNIMLLRIDPNIPITTRDKNGNILNFNNKRNLIMANLQSAGFKFHGKTKYFENEKPRWEAITVLNKDIRALFASFDKRTRHKIRKAINSGVQVFKDEEKHVRYLYEFVKKKTKKPSKYYSYFVQNFGDAIDIYYAKINTEIFVVNSRRLYEREMAKNDEMARTIQTANLDTRIKNKLLNQKMDSDKLVNSYKNSLVKATELLKQYPNGMIIAGAMVMKYNNAAYILVDGFNPEYSYLNASYAIKWKMIDDFNKQGYKFLNLNAVVGEFEKKNKFSGLNELKLGFNSVITEYIGEFDIILNNFAYGLNNKFNKDK